MYNIIMSLLCLPDDILLYIVTKLNKISLTLFAQSIYYIANLITNKTNIRLMRNCDVLSQVAISRDDRLLIELIKNGNYSYNAGLCANLRYADCYKMLGIMIKNKWCKCEGVYHTI